MVLLLNFLRRAAKPSGNSAIMAILAIGLVGVLAGLTFSLVKVQKFYKTEMDVHNIATNIRNNIYANIRDRLAWDQTKNAAKNAASFSCVLAPAAFPNGCCLDSGTLTSSLCATPYKGAFSVFNAIGQTTASTVAYVDHTRSTQGFTTTGAICNKYPSADCPFHYDVTWSPVCAQNNCKLDGISQVVITATFHAQGLKFLSSNFSVNESLYSFKVFRDFGNNGAAGTSNMRSFDNAGSYTLTLDKDIKTIMIEVWGGGGGGAGGAEVTQNASSFDVSQKMPDINDYFLAGGGGGGGSYIRQTITNLVGGETLQISVGKGGEGVSGNHHSGYSGDESSIRIYRPSGTLMTTVTAKGGFGGSRCNIAPPPDDCGPGGSGGTSVIDSAYANQAVTFSGDPGRGFMESKDQYYDPGTRVASGSNSPALNEQQTIRFSAPPIGGTLDITGSGGTQTISISSSDSGSTVSGKILAAVQALYPAPAVVTMANSNWSTTSSSSFVLEFGGSLATQSVPLLVITANSLVPATPQSSNFAVKEVIGHAGDSFATINTYNNVSLSKYNPNPLILFDGAITGTGSSLDGVTTPFTVGSVTSSTQFTVKLPSPIASNFDFVIPGGKGNVGAGETAVSSLGYLNFVGVGVAITQNAQQATSVTYNYDPNSVAYRIKYYGGRGGNGAGGGGSGGANDHDNVGVAPFSPGGGGAGKMLRGLDINGNDSHTQNGAPGKVIVWF